MGVGRQVALTMAALGVLMLLLAWFGMYGTMSLPVAGERPINAHRVNGPGQFTVLSIPQKNLLFCSIPKCASTAHRGFLYRLVTGQKLDDVEAAHVWFSQLRLPSATQPGLLTDNSPQFLAAVDNPNLIKVALVRHPVERLLSAFLNKIAPRPNGRNGQLFDWYPQLPRDITFREFVHNVVAKESPCSWPAVPGRILRQEHWMDQHCFCGLAKQKHKYKVFSLREAPQMVRYLVDSKVVAESDASLYGYGHKGEELFGFKHTTELRSSSESAICKHYTNDLIKTVLELYHTDMVMFNFDFEEFKCPN